MRARRPAGTTRTATYWAPTSREDLLVNPEEHAAVVSLRRALAALDSQHAPELLPDKTAIPNEQFLRQVSAAK